MILLPVAAVSLSGERAVSFKTVNVKVLQVIQMSPCNRCMRLPLKLYHLVVIQHGGYIPFSLVYQSLNFII